MTRGNILVRTLALCLMAGVAVGSPAEELGRARQRPWSGNVHAFDRVDLAFARRGEEMSALDKYDVYLGATRGWERVRYSSVLEADPAHGHNTASATAHAGGGDHGMGWAAAALVEPEPTEDLLLRFDGAIEKRALALANPLEAARLLEPAERNYRILPADDSRVLEFTVADLKGLLAETYMVANGPRVREPDLTPARFHAALRAEIGVRKRGFVVDVLAGANQRWLPAYAYRTTHLREGNLCRCRTEVTFASDEVTPDFVGTLDVIRTYTYELFLDDEGRVLESAWTGDSVSDHPGELWFNANAIPGANVPAIDLSILDEIRAYSSLLVPVIPRPALPPRAEEQEVPARSMITRNRFHDTFSN